MGLRAGRDTVALPGETTFWGAKVLAAFPTDDVVRREDSLFGSARGMVESE